VPARLPGLARLAIALAKRANPACPAKCGGQGGRGGLEGRIGGGQGRFITL